MEGTTPISYHGEEKELEVGRLEMSWNASMIGGILKKLFWEKKKMRRELKRKRAYS